jgi:hypothetical protein
MPDLSKQRVGAERRAPQSDSVGPNSESDHSERSSSRPSQSSTSLDSRLSFFSTGSVGDVAAQEDMNQDMPAEFCELQIEDVSVQDFDAPSESAAEGRKPRRKQQQSREQVCFAGCAQVLFSHRYRC